MKDGINIILMPKETNQKDIQRIMEIYNDSKNIIFVSGKEDMKTNLYKLLKVNIN